MQTVAKSTIHLMMVVTLALSGCAQTDQRDWRLAGRSQIAAALKQVSAQHIQANIEKLVSFGTRLTLSAQDPDSIAAVTGSARRGSGSSRNLNVIRKIAADVWK